MVIRIVGIIIFVFCIPLTPVHAIPPPDLIISLSQSVLSALGLLTASLIVALSSIRIYFQNLMILPWVRYGFIIAVVATIGIGGTFIFFYQQQAELHDWQSGVDQELRTAWQRYDGVYGAENELAARKKLNSSAKEVTWSEFSEAVDGREYLIVDIRDIHAYQAGQFNDSIHMRFADLLRGRWQELEMYKNTPILLVCYLGTTGAIAGDFLTAKGFTEVYQPKDGLRTMVKSAPQLPFTGITFSDHYFDTIQRMNHKQMTEAIETGASVIDVRNATSAAAITPSTTYSFYREYATLPEIDTFVGSLPTNIPYLLLCDSDASCYQAEMLYLDLLEQSLSVAGIYNHLQPEGVHFERPEYFNFY